ncbi:MAG TPA: hypothetical protein VMT93_06975 [Gemmatimonadaceae bacterium]|nr:hypothetical protein [Gemmatimonadaceae bacterium]
MPAPVAATARKPAPNAPASRPPKRATAPSPSTQQPQPSGAAATGTAPAPAGQGTGGTVGPHIPLTLPPVVVHAKPKPKPKPRPTGLTARQRFVRDSVARAAFLRDSLARAEFVRDSLARERFVRDSLARAAFVRDSLARAAFVRDSLARVAFVRDSLARAAFLRDSLAQAQRRHDSLAAKAAADSAYGPDGDLPQIQQDPNIQRPTAGLEVDYYRQVKDNYWQVVASYARPFEQRKASWEIDVPWQWWTSVPPGGYVTGPANASLIVNRRFTEAGAKWRVIGSLTLNPQASFLNDTLGNNQWIITPQVSVSRWFASDRLQVRLLTYWQYGFWVDSGTTKKNILVPRLVLNSRITDRLYGGLDYRPRFDFQRDQFYSTLQAFASYALANSLGLQAGYEFPLDSLGRVRVEISKTYLTLSKTFR